jgi:hypothetical protein
MNTIPPCYLSPEGMAAVKARAAIVGADLAARRILRATAQTLDIDVDKIASERRVSERRAHPRDGATDRRFGTMQDKLAAEAQRRDSQRFSGFEHSALMGLDS